MRGAGLVALLALVAGVAVSGCASTATSEAQRRTTSPTGGKLIEWGWDEPDPRFMRQHLAEMERTPFDGCVFKVNYRGANGEDSSFTWQTWGRRAFTAAELQPALDDLRATPFRRFRNNFLRMNVTPGDLSWFDDYSAVIANARLAARVARLGGCRGVILDVEQYEGKLFSYEEQTRAHPCSWDSLSAQVRRRGAEILSAMQEEWPDLLVFLTWGYSMPLYQTEGGRVPLPRTLDGLLVPFLDGMFAAARGNTVLMDGHEMSYPYRTASQFAAAADSMRHGVLRLAADSVQYRRHARIAFGIWVDLQWRERGWNGQDAGKNYVTPDALAKSVRAALALTDEYVWVYTEQPRWWTAKGGTERLPPGYDRALRRVPR